MPDGGARESDQATTATFASLCLDSATCTIQCCALERRSPMKRGLVIATVFMLLAGMSFAIVAFNGWFPLDRYRELFEFYANRKAIAQYIKDAGPSGPIVFIILPALQVVAAPRPRAGRGG